MSEIVGMLQAHEMKMTSGKKTKGVALTKVENEDTWDTDSVTMQICRFDMALWRVEHVQLQKSVNSEKNL